MSKPDSNYSPMERAWFRGPIRERREYEPCDINAGHSVAVDLRTAIEVLDPFQAQVHWPLRLTLPLLGRMGDTE